MKLRFAALALAVLAVTPAARAGVDIDLGAQVNINDHTNVFLAISSRYYERDRATVAAYGSRFDDPDDLAVALFIQQHCRRSLEEIWILRGKQLSWWEISLRFGVPVDAWFVPVRRTPAPPYGNAYGHWKKHKDQPASMVVTDDDARNLVAVRMVHDYYGIAVETAMQWRSDGTKVADLMAEEYKRRHDPGRGGDKSRGKGKRQGKSKAP